MNKMLRFALTALAMAGVSAVPSLCLAQGFTLTVPFRPAVVNPNNNQLEEQPQTSKVVVLIETTSDMAGPGVSVAGATILAPATACTVNAATCDALGTFATGDSARATWLTPRKLRVTLRFTTEFPTNLCDTTRTVDRTATLAFSNLPGAGVSYRMAGYAVPERQTAANPTPKCDVAFRRVKSPFLTQTSGTAVTNAGRLPMDVILVLDKSGSMGWNIPGQAVQRYARLKAAVGQFMQLYMQSGAVEGSPDDRMGLVFFDSAPADPNLSGGTIFKKRANGWDDVTHGDIISAQLALPQFQPGGNTSIGGGINRAKLRWDALVAAGDSNDPTFVVFTDGEQNTPPCVNSAGEADVFPCTTTRTQPLQLSGTTRLANLQVPILPIGLGANSGSFADLLQKIAFDTAGDQFKLVANGPALDMAFDDDLVAVLKGNTLSLLGRISDTMPASGPGAPLTTFIDASMRRVTFVLSWEGGAQLGLEIRNPGGIVVAPVVSGGGASYAVASIDVPASGPVGEWTARPVRIIIQEPDLQGHGPSTAQPPPNPAYHLDAFAVEGRLDYRLIVKTAPVGTDLPVFVRAEISFDGKPLDNLPAGAVRVTPLRPGENFGTILSQSSATGTPQSNGGETQSSLGAKVDQLAATDNLLDRTEGKPLATQSMKEAGHGVYEAKFDQTIVGGQYRFRVDLDWTDARTSRIRRIELLEQQVPVRPTPAATQVQVDTMSATTAQIAITLLDNHGNLVGPGYGSAIVVTVAPPAVVGPITNPNDQGRYLVSITNLTPGSDPQVTITYDGQVLRDAPLSEVDKPQLAQPLSVGIRAGVAVPHGTFGSTWDPGFSFEADVEYAATPIFGIQGVVGYSRFGGTSSNLDLGHASVRAKVYSPGANPRFAGFAGIGGYYLGPGGGHFGFNAGGVVEWVVAPRWSVEVTYTFHSVDTPVKASQFSTFHGGLRYRF